MVELSDPSGLSQTKLFYFQNRCFETIPPLIWKFKKIWQDMFLNVLKQKDT